MTDTSPQQATPALELSRVVKSFGAVVALRSGSIRLEKGSIHALIGENGAGKSTMVKIIAGLYRRDAGEFHLDGEPVDFGMVLTDVSAYRSSKAKRFLKSMWIFGEQQLADVDAAHGRARADLRHRFHPHLTRHLNVVRHGINCGATGCVGGKPGARLEYGVSPARLGHRVFGQIG